MAHPNLTNFSFLDPKLFMDQVNAAHPGTITKDALLDPVLMQHQINTAIENGHDIFANGFRGITDCYYWNPVKLATAIG